MTKKTPTKRQVPSVERQLALALVAVLNEIRRPSADDDSLTNAVDAAQTILEANGYAKLESIASRVNRIEGLIEQAYEKKEFAVIAPLAAELERAKKGLSPLAGKKKKAEPTAPKPARASRKSSKGDAPDPATVPVKCNYSICQWKGEGVVGSPCPECEAPLVAVEKENTDA